MTAAGVSSGVDMGLRLAQLIAGDELAQAIRLSIEYDRQRPLDAGSPAKAPEAIVQLVRRHALGWIKDDAEYIAQKISAFQLTQLAERRAGEPVGLRSRVA
jgi:hypothetical protein